MNTQQVEEILPIINGSANPRLTVEKFLKLPFETRREVLWNTMVKMQYHHYNPEIDPSVFTPMVERVSYEHITVENVDEIYLSLVNDIRAKTEHMLERTRMIDIERGKKIFLAQRDLKFSGTLEMNAARLAGYLYQSGGFNQLNPVEVVRRIHAIEEVAPRVDYGPNNPNTGMICHKWKTNGGSDVILEYDFVNEKMASTITRKLESIWVSYGESAKADVRKMTVTEFDGCNKGYFNIRFVWWWD